VRATAVVEWGFVDALRIAAEQLVEEREGIARAFAELVERGLSLSGLTSLRLRPLSDEAAETLAGLPLLEQVDLLDLGHRVGVRAVHAVAHSPHVGAVRVLIMDLVDGDAISPKTRAGLVERFGAAIVFDELEEPDALPPKPLGELGRIKRMPPPPRRPRR
jgi:hypothetical protein